MVGDDVWVIEESAIQAPPPLNFAFNEVRVVIATRPETRMGSDETWDRSESALIEAVKQRQSWADATIKTLLGRLMHKGAVKSVRQFLSNAGVKP